MNKSLKSVFIAVLVNINIFCTVAQKSDPVISAIKQEVDRNLKELKMEGFSSPFFISYAITDLHQMLVEASFGAVTQSFETHERTGLPLALVGNFQRNNLKWDVMTNRQQKISLDNDPAAIGFSIWTDLDVEYKQALQYYERKKSMLNTTMLTPEELSIPDYEQIPVKNLILPPEKINMDRKYWEKYARAASAIAIKYPEIITSNVKIELKNGMHYYYDTEGCQFVVPCVHCEVSFQAGVMTDDGEKFNDYISVGRSSTDRIPSLEIFVDECEKAIVQLIKLRNAPLADKSYSGPVLYEKRSLEHFIKMNFFNNQLSAHTKFLVNNGRGENQLEMKTGERIISNQLTVKSLSGTKVYKGQILDGYFPIDGEGVVPSEELTLIENGVLKNMLTRRIPTVKNQHSNGHYRFNLGRGNSAPGRYIEPGVIQITGNNVYPEAEMKQKLIEAARNAGLEYAYIVNDGFIRIYVADGREELVRGLENDSFSLSLNSCFKRILGVSDEEFIVSSQFLSALSTLIAPKSILFEELDLSIKNRSNLSPPFKVSKPTK